MMKRRTPAILIAFALAAVPAEAQTEADKQKVKTYDFSGDNIDGELIKPDGEMFNVQGFASHTSLIRIRQDFIREILKSAENL